ncbi:Protein of unknown function [Cotesia congregata]|uniref:Uncharacterized protein n=1 Tax=Cotesia congregata TaxID=51543 RepID=A0A8J2MIA8_COTCN|nr:Protein of unknown function [Cotesia congregata]
MESQQKRSYATATERPTKEQAIIIEAVDKVPIVEYCKEIVPDNILGKQKLSPADLVDKVTIIEPQTSTSSTNIPDDNQLMQLDESPESQKTANKRLHSDTESTPSTVGNDNTPFITPTGTFGISKRLINVERKKTKKNKSNENSKDPLTLNELENEMTKNAHKYPLSYLQLCNFMDKVINKVHPKTAAADYLVEPTQLIIMLRDLYERLQSQRAKYRFSSIIKKLGTKLADDTESDYDSQASDARHF